jgi:replicative DNA helicase
MRREYGNQKRMLVVID